MNDSLPITAIALLPLMGMVAYVGVQHLWLWRGRRDEPLHLWAVGWCANTLLLLVSHYAQLAARSPDGAAAWARIAWMSALLLIPLVIGLVRAVVGVRCTPAFRVLVGIATAGLLGSLCVPGLLLTARIHARTDALGYQIWGPVPGPLLPALAPVLFVAVGYALTLVWRSRTLERGERRAMLLGLSLYAAFGLNDLLESAGLMRSVRLVDYGFVAVALGLDYLLARRFSRLSQDLEVEVRVRTRELEGGRDRLDALVRAGRAVMAGLDLDHSLKEIAGAAARLMSAASVMVWIADEEQEHGRLELRAGSDEALVAGHPNRTLRFGEGIVGWVAQNRTPRLVLDVEVDPQMRASAWFAANGLRSGFAVPIIHGDRLLGVVSLLARQALRLSDDERAVLQGFVDQAAIAIRNASLHAAEIEARRAAERALAEVRELQGLLPICSYCKSVRNDQNYWQKIESYIGERSRAQFTHGICPDCRETVVAAELAQWRTKEMAAREPVTATRDT